MATISTSWKTALRSADAPSSCWSKVTEASRVTPEGFNVRTRVHEYGEGAFTVADGVIYFSNLSDGRIYAQRRERSQGDHSAGAFRYADCVAERRRLRLICVREDHSAGPDPKKIVNALVDISLAKEAPSSVLWGGSDFVAPRACHPTAGSSPLSPGTIPICRGTPQASRRRISVTTAP